MHAQKAGLDDLQLFCAVARERSFTRVSETLGIPLATISRRVANLEQQLDARLLRRSTRRVEPTDAGQLLLERSEGPLRDLAEALGRSVELEASGGVGLADVERVAASGVDRISVGALTHSAPVLDLSLQISAVTSADDAGEARV